MRLNFSVMFVVMVVPVPMSVMVVMAALAPVMVVVTLCLIANRHPTTAESASAFLAHINFLFPSDSAPVRMQAEGRLVAGQVIASESSHTNPAWQAGAARSQGRAPEVWVMLTQLALKE